MEELRKVMGSGVALSNVRLRQEIQHPIPSSTHATTMGLFDIGGGEGIIIFGGEHQSQ